MRFLENRIPPPIVTLLFAIDIWVMSIIIPAAALLTGPYSLLVAYGLLALGFGMAVAGVIGFRVAATTVNPLKPETATSLVTCGVFQYSRNPMYVGLTCLLLALTVYLAAGWGLLAVSLFIAYIYRFQIVPEERAMHKLFGAEYKAYQSSVRRWL